MIQDKLQQEFINKGVEFFQRENKGYLDLAMRFGKCRVAIEILRELHPYMILIAYPDNTIRETWEKEILKWKYLPNAVYFTNFSSLEKWKALNPDVFIIDEFHKASPKERDLCHQIMTNSPEIKTLCLSGTISKETKAEWGVKEIGSYSTLQGIKDEVLADYKITIHQVDLDTQVKTPNRKGKLLSEKQRYDNYTYVIEKMKKDGDNYMHLALSRNRISLSSIAKRECVLSLLKGELKDKRTIIFTGLSAVADNLDIPSFHSKSPNDNNFQAFQRKEFPHLALVNTGATGVTYTDLDCVILLNFVANEEATAQSLNRAIKLDYKGKCADLRIIALKEIPEQKKLKESLSMLDNKKIKYL